MLNAGLGSGLEASWHDVRFLRRTASGRRAQAPQGAPTASHRTSGQQRQANAEAIWLRLETVAGGEFQILALSRPALERIPLSSDVVRDWYNMIDITAV